MTLPRTAPPSTGIGDRDLRVAVVGAGLMGADHVRRITSRIQGARVVSIVEPDEGRAASAVADAPGSTARARLEESIERDEPDAVLIATPGFLHAPVLLPALQAGLEILCEKPLTPDPESSLEILEAEQATGRPRIQVGFMRRFDTEYAQLHDLVASGDAGQLLALHCAHRNPSVPDSYTEQMMITDSVVHEFDVVPWLAGSDIASVEVRKLRRNSAARFADPQLVLIELVNDVLAVVEISVNAQFGYQVKTEAVFERGVAETGRTAGLSRWQDGSLVVGEHASFVTRFAAAYDAQIQRWVDAARRGTIDGPSAWDGYRVAAACAAGVEAQRTSGRVEVVTVPRPAFYGGAG
ncbi:MAG: myo-inositol 2-dehydrogenase / D-chiro-inositol 1-dehydrogenase [Microbacteriaceae bacterium]|nr:myo-inositol 2-dehydrogenase / D-chiro-inositol 1-dehydrogenase [Microbacteriaceae bacterium]